MTLRPFFCFYGGKWRVAPRYPAPHYGRIVEPFAGSAGYSLRYSERDILLVDKDPVIAGLWDYLIHVPESEIAALPLTVGHVDEIKGPQEAKWLVGFWLNKGTSAPSKTPSAWYRSGIRGGSFWGPEIRDRIVAQLPQIRHWRVQQGSYESIPDQSATWFIDPPYSTPAGQHYRLHDVDYAHLGEWCREREGQVIVCEQDGASWLPFEPFRSIKANESSRGKKKSAEVLWRNA